MQNKTYKQLRKELLKDKKIKYAYEKLGPEFAVKVGEALDVKLKISLKK